MNNSKKRINFVLSEQAKRDLDALAESYAKGYGSKTKSDLVHEAIQKIRLSIQEKSLDLPMVTAVLDDELARRGIADPPRDEHPKEPDVLIIGGGVMGLLVSTALSGELRTPGNQITASTTLRNHAWLQSGLLYVPPISGVRTAEDLLALGDEKFEEFLMDRFSAMGFWVTKVGRTSQPDGGIDFIFESQDGSAGNLVIGAAQVKHHSRPSLKVGVDVVRDMAGVLQRHYGRFNLGMVITNTSFTEEAEWFVKPIELLLRLRQGDDVQRWAAGDFSNKLERREFPKSIQVTRNMTVDLRQGHLL